MSCGGGDSGSSQSSQSSAQLDPQVKQAELDWYANQQKIQQAAQGASLTQTGTDANGDPTYGATAYTPYTDQRVAGLNPLQTAAMNGYQPGSYLPALSDASSSLSGVGTQGDLSKYMNPFTQDVTNTTINDFKRASDINAMTSQQAATTQGAFGGSGQGVFQANNQDNLNRTLASTLAGLNQTNFQNAENQDIAEQGLALGKAQGLTGIGQAMQQGQMNDATTLMGLGQVGQNTTQNQLDWNYNNNYYNPNYMQPQWDVQLANMGQGNMPNAQTLNSSSGSGDSSSCNGSL